VQIEREAWDRAVAEHRTALQGREEENLSATRSMFKEHEQALTALHSIHLGLWYSHNSVRDRTPVQGALSMLAFRAANDLLAAWCLISHGYYVAANSMFRAVYEAWISIFYFWQFPDDANLWWKMDPTRQEEDRMRVGQMRRRLEEAGHIDQEVRRFYGTLSSMTHPTADSMYPGIVVKESTDERQLEFAVVGRFDERKTLYHASVVMMLGLDLAKLIGRALPGAVGQPNSPYESVQEMDRYLKALASHFKLGEELLTLTPEEVYGLIHHNEP
jgi:hypothetical protein